jgi:hypothetical protein
MDSEVLMLANTRPRLAAAVLALVALSVFVGGCRSPFTRTIAAQNGEAWTGQALALDIHNEMGDVVVEVDPSLDRPRVEARFRAVQPLTKPTQSRLIRESDVRTEYETDGDGRVVMRVLSAGGEGALATHLRIRVPRNDGVKVETSDGRILLLGVGGPIHARNGGEGRPGGDVHVRTAAPVRQEVDIWTSEGSVLFQVGENSAGDLDLTAADGYVRVDGRVGTLRAQQITGHDRMRAVFNGGSNPIRLHSERGQVRVRIHEDPRNHRPWM